MSIQDIEPRCEVCSLPCGLCSWIDCFRRALACINDGEIEWAARWLRTGNQELDSLVELGS